MDHVLDLASEISESSSLVSEDLRTLDGSVDGEPRADGLYEERFRVDRRKLESMLLGLFKFFNNFIIFISLKVTVEQKLCSN